MEPLSPAAHDSGVFCCPEGNGEAAAGTARRGAAALNSLGGCKCGRVVSTLSQIDTRQL